MASETLLARITDYASRPNPYPLYAELREAGPVVQQADGSYLITAPGRRPADRPGVSTAAA